VLTSFADEDALKKVTPYWFEDPSEWLRWPVPESTGTLGN